MKRITFVQYISFAILFALLARTGWFSLVRSEELSTLASAQHSGIQGNSPRGMIYDRNMLALTNSTTALRIVIHPEKCENSALVSQLSGCPVSGNKPIYCDIPQNYEIRNQLLSQKGVYIVNAPDRYLDNGVLSHLIGYKSGDSGSGIERAMDSFLSDTNENEGIKLTIDYHIQEICEQALDKASINGAVVLAEASTGNIVSLVSRPNFNPNSPVSYLDSANGELMNRAISSYDIGSVFKIVISAAALSEGLVTPDSPFICYGNCNITGKTFYCHNLAGHGEQTFAQAFANSCNIPFYELGRRLGMKKIYEYAIKLGFNSKTLNVDLHESAGYIPNERYPSARLLANLGIGQGDIQVTPLQVAKMLCIVSNLGQDTHLNIVSSIIDKNKEEHPFRIFEPAEHLLSDDVCRTILSFMQLTVEHGTGTGARPSNGTAGGKTGTAQTGWVKDGETMTHGWFAGVFPAENPQYVCVVLAENGKQGSTTAAPVFKEISEKINQYYK